MIAPAPQRQPLDVLPVGDVRRRTTGRAVLLTLWIAALFEIFTIASKEIPFLYVQVPWANDPYDTAVSFAIFFIPVVMAVSSIRLSLCKRNQPLPVSRLGDLVRGCRVILIIVLVTVVSNWISVMVEANHHQLTHQIGLLVGVMVILTLTICKVTLDIYRVPRFSFMSRSHTTNELDWISDAATFLRLQSVRFGPLQEILAGIVDWFDLHLLAKARRNPIKSAFVVSFVFGVLIALSQARESGFGWISLLFLLVPVFGMFAFLMIVGNYLGLVRSHRALDAREQREVDAIVLACAAVPISLAFRNSLWWVIGSNESRGHLSRLSALLAVIAVVVFLIGLVFESVAGVHADRSEGRNFPVT